MKKRKIIIINTVAVLKHKLCDIEWHLENKDPNAGYRGLFPLNWFQVMLYNFLGFQYISGPDYIDYMSEKFKKKNIRRKNK